MLLKITCIKNYRCVCILALVIRHSDRVFFEPYYIVVCGLSGCAPFSYIITKTARFSKNKIKIKLNKNLSVLIFSATLVQNISHYNQNSASYYH